ncbi:DNA-binding response regulator [Bacillus sp. V3-13]|uniref:helix-turn-helix domain-containing protein n=1 Tax=Bacillus sp. V3-13 TaxID=2053728 RepID=UPI000C781639|nr:helix-turn-helix domain-containing protein [Bacillus sp. V3-13]PLR77399.1 DNA-binding response regulator [Bacillus sp. V3-13]
MAGLLILDYEKIIRQEIKLMLQESQYNHLSIYESDSGKSALSIFQQKRPSLVMMDLSLPDVDGIQLGKELIKISPQVAIIVLSQLKMFEIVEASINAGFCGYLMKPLSKGKLLNVVDRLQIPDLIQHSPGLREETESVDDLKNPVKHALDFIHNKYQDEITLHEVANYVYLSDCYFSRLFKAEMKISFIEYLKKYRLNQAKKLLKTTSFPIEVVANNTGFANASYFTTTFKRMEGKTPTEYRGDFVKLFHKSSLKG